MPNPPTHIDLAYQAAQRLPDSSLNPNLGYFLLGATAPDVRAITKFDRRHYHFAPLDFEFAGEGVRNLFDSHPELRRRSALDEKTGAFVAGYITHLVLDESWIVEMYRPYFGNREIFVDDALGNVMDRATQLEMDRLSQNRVGEVGRQVKQASGPVDIELISHEVLSEWRSFMAEYIDRGFSWGRLRFLSGRIARGDETHPAYRVADDFLADVPAGLGRLWETVPYEKVIGFRERSVELLVETVEDYIT